MQKKLSAAVLSAFAISHLLTIAGASPGELGPFPSWPHDFSFTFATTGNPNHPALQGVADGYKAHVTNLAKSLTPHQGSVCYSVNYGDLAVSRPDTNGDGLYESGAVDVGLDNVMHAILHRDESYAIQGILLVGIDSLGSSRAKYGVWTNPATNLEDIAFFDLIPASPPGERYMSVGIVLNCMYIFEGTSGEVRRYIDTADPDALPDTLDASVTPVDLDSQPAQIPVDGFFEAPNDAVGIKYGLEDPAGYWVIGESAGSLTLDRVEPALTTRAVIAGPAVAGMGNLVVSTAKLTSIWLVGGPMSTQVLSRVVPIDEGEGYHTIDLTRPLVPTDRIVIHGVDADSTAWQSDVQQDVEAIRPVFMYGPPYYWRSGKRLIFNVENVSEFSIVSVKIDGVLTPSSNTIVPARTVVMDPLFLPPGSLGQIVWVSIDNPAYPGTTAKKRILLIPQQP